MVLGEEKIISVGLNHDLFVYIFMSSVIRYIFKGKCLYKSFAFL